MGGEIAVGELRAALAALPGSAALVVTVCGADGEEAWADRTALGIVGDPRWRSSYACISAYVEAGVDWEWGPE